MKLKFCGEEPQNLCNSFLKLSKLYFSEYSGLGYGDIMEHSVLSRNVCHVETCIYKICWYYYWKHVEDTYVLKENRMNEVKWNYIEEKLWVVTLEKYSRLKRLDRQHKSTIVRSQVRMNQPVQEGWSKYCKLKQTKSKVWDQRIDNNSTEGQKTSRRGQILGHSLFSCLCC